MFKVSACGVRIMSGISEIWIGELRDYKYALRLDREEYPAVLVYEYDSSSTRNYLFTIKYSDQRPNWQLITRDAALTAYDLLNRGGEFTTLSFPGATIHRSVSELSRLH
ncbi:Mbb1p [Saccharomyces cerevisiae]|uniref:Mbb1 n=1 Tax=Saccharomyces pastorianus TaxID=27292 RepID=A0A6C1DTC1_SACPS